MKKTRERLKKLFRVAALWGCCTCGVVMGGSEDHHESDQYWAELAKMLPSYEVNPAKLRVAAPNERYLMGTWSPRRSWPHIPVSAANLPDGRVLTFASNERTRFPGGRPEFTYAAVWDPETDQITEINHNSHDMFCGHLVMLENGNVFINGGRNTTPLTSEFDFRTDSWNRLENMTVGRWYPTTTFLANGEVFTASGNGGPNNAERWTRGQGWTRLTGINWSSIAGAPGFESNWWPYNFLAPNGRIFHAGPTDAMHWVDPSGLGSLQTSGDTVPGTKYPKHGAVAMFDEGKLIIAGGASSTSGGSTAEVYIVDINSEDAQVSNASNMAFPRRFSNPVMLPTGEFLVIGGNTSGTKFSDNGTVLTPELWNPDTGEWRQMSDMAVPRNYHSVALLLADGRVMAAGGGLCGCSADHQDAEIFTPHYLFNPDGSLAARPVIQTAPAVISHGSNFRIEATAGLSRFTMVKMMATTHALSTDIRFLPVPFTESAPGVYDLSSHANANVLTPGYWMLFGLNDSNVPSEAAIVQVGSLLNASPLITSPGNQVYRLGQIVDLVVSATDPEGTALNFSSSGLPDGLRMDPVSGRITGTVIKAGNFESLITVTDEGGQSANLTLNWIISSGIICEDATNIAFDGTATQSSEFSVGPRPASNAIDGNKSTFTHTEVGQTPSWWQLEWPTEKSIQMVRLFNRTDCCGARFSDLRVEIFDAGGSLTFQSEVLNRDNLLGAPASLTIDVIAETGGAVTGRVLRVTRTRSTVISADNDATLLSLAEVEVIGCDRITGNRAPIVASPGTQAHRIGESVRLALVANDPDGDPLAFSATGLPEGLVLNSSTGIIDGTLAEAGSFNVNITVDDGQNGITSTGFLWIVSSQQGVVYNFASFADPSLWQVNGSAAFAGEVLRLTPAVNSQAGSAFIKAPVDLTANPDFTAQFRFRIHGAADGADGMSFVLQGLSPEAIGSVGGGLGLSGMMSSLAVEIDTYQNGTSDRSGNEIAVIQNGIVTAPLAAVAVPPATVDLEDGNIHNLWVDYRAATRTLMVFLAAGDTAVKPVEPLIRVGDIDLVSLVGNQAFVGFTGGTGGLNNNHDVHSFSFRQGGVATDPNKAIRYQWWTGISGNSISSLTSSPQFPDSPSGSVLVDLFEGYTNFADNYGSRLSGVLYPPVSGEYIFWVSGDDNTELWLSSDQTPSNRTRIATVPGWTSPRQWTKFPEQKSAPVSLIAGKPYFIEALHKEGGGLDNLAAAWEIPGQPLAVIDGQYFIAPDDVLGRAGLFGQYFDGRNFDTQRFTRGDESVDFNWGTGSPDAGRLGADNFSIRWTGFLTPEFSETYTFYTNSDDGVRLWVGDKLIIDNWTDHAPTENSGQINLTADRPVPIKLEYYENGGGAVIQLAWSSTSLAKQVIAPAFLHQGVDNPDLAPIVDSPGDLVNPTGAVVSLQIAASDPEGEPLTYSATGLPPELLIDTATGIISGTLVSAGNYNVTVSATDTGGSSGQASFGWVVTDELFVDTIRSLPAVAGSAVSLEVPVSGGLNPRFQWNFGDGSPLSDVSSSPAAQHVYENPGVYFVTVTITDDTGKNIRQSFLQGVHLPLQESRPVSSSTVIVVGQDGIDRLWNVNPDNNTVAVSNISTLQTREIAVGRKPRSLAAGGAGLIYVTNKDDDTISVIDSASATVQRTIQLPYGSHPHGIVTSPDGTYFLVALEGRGQVMKFNAATGELIATLDAGLHVRHLAISGDSATAWVSRFITPPLPGEAQGMPAMDGGAEVLRIGTSDMTLLSTVILRPSDRTDAENAARGVPNYLGAPALSPDGTMAWVPSKQDNVFRGTARDGKPLTHDSTVRAISSKISIADAAEEYEARVDHDNAGNPSAAIFGPNGLYVFVALEASQAVAVISAYENLEIGRFNVGAAPQGLALSPDGTRLMVHNFLSRSISIHDISQLVQYSNMRVSVVGSMSTVANETLSPEILLGKKLFYDARDTRLAREQYISCASCHNDGGSDGRVWDISSLGEGLRNTIELNGRSGMAHGMLHWSGNFDEVQDFEDQIRNLAGGTGLIPDSRYNSGSVSVPLGDPKTGLSAELDALAAYVSSLSSVGRSPFRNPDGSLSAAATAGREVFIQANCVSCHTGVNYTDSAPGVSHDIGTISALSGRRLGGLLAGIDTPTLRGVWKTAPYFHDGSADSLETAVARHAGVDLTPGDLGNLVAFLRETDDSSGMAPGNQPPSITPVDPVQSDQGEAVEIALTGTDPEGAVITWSAEGLPSGVSVSETGGLISGTPNVAGVYNVTVTARDAGGGFAIMTFQWTVREVLPPVEPVKITLDGNLDDWSPQSLVLADPLDVSGENLQVDLRELRIDHDETSLCLAYVNEYPLTLNWGFLLYLDTDLNGGTGFSFWGLGADYMINGRSLFRYTGDGATWSWEPLLEVPSAVAGNIAEMGFPLSFIGSPEAMNILFYGDNAAFGSSGGDFVPDIKNGAVQRVVYSFNDSPGTGSGIVIDGQFDDWSDVTRFAADPRDVVAGALDWNSFWLTRDESAVYLSFDSWRNYPQSWAENVYFDTDANAESGYRVGQVGAEFLLQSGIFYRYTGNGSSWSWTANGNVEVARNSMRVEACIPLSALGDPAIIRIQLLAANEAYASGNDRDLFPDDGRGLVWRPDGQTGNARPSVQDISVTTRRGLPRIIRLIGNDAENDALTYTLTSQPGGGTVTLTDDTVLYEPSDTFTGTDSFTYVANDSDGSSQPGTVNVEVLGSLAGFGRSARVGNIAVDGILGDWGAVPPAAYDPSDVDATGTEVDWRNLWLGHDDEFAYIAFRNDSDIQLSWGQTFYLDADRDPSTGFAIRNGGADYMIQGEFIFRYTGTGSDWSWEFVSAAVVAVIGTDAEIRFERGLLGTAVEGYDILCYGDNSAFGLDGVTDVLPDSSLSWFQYAFNDSVIADARDGIPAAVDSRLEQRYNLRILTDKPEAASAETAGSFLTRTLRFEMLVKPGYRLILERTEDLENWSIVYQRVIREEGYLLVDPEIDTIPENGYFRAILVEEPLSDTGNSSF